MLGGVYFLNISKLIIITRRYLISPGDGGRWFASGRATQIQIGSFLEQQVLGSHKVLLIVVVVAMMDVLLLVRDLIDSVQFYDRRRMLVLNGGRNCAPPRKQQP